MICLLICEYWTNRYAFTFWRVFCGYFSRQILSLADYNSIEVGVGVSPSRFEEISDWVTRNDFTHLIPLRTRPHGLVF